MNTLYVKIDKDTKEATYYVNGVQVDEERFRGLKYDWMIIDEWSGVPVSKYLKQE